MTDAAAIREVLATYKKHGWILRRVLLSERTEFDLSGSSAGIFGDVTILSSDIDAAWFSRPPSPGGVAWEIRFWGDPPFALLENIDEQEPDFEDRLRDAETRLAQTIAAKKSA
jgi:hypothetical protein